MVFPWLLTALPSLCSLKQNAERPTHELDVTLKRVYHIINSVVYQSASTELTDGDIKTHSTYAQQLFI